MAIPSSITSVGDFAFRDCDFDSVSIPRSVNYIGQDAFPDRCKILREKSPSGSGNSHGGNKGLKKLFGLR
ncbi:MAG: leucine-rich repeat protein [Candidatus Methanomethylophilaceae archaeon]|nr:leucine-rich repeat protein [Candidatus Methanomethylophilaceae archaeon]MBR6213043.1 leucine-rich repeat protein [Candidatus Methanomethylophilaceae archaeon]